jgi:biotin-(acetyl-CoA carboxylase) ligase
MTFLDKLTKRLEDFNPEALIADWKSNNITLGRHVTVTTLKNTVKGKALDIDSYGGLILQRADGSRETVVHGDCFHS